jgi:D-beta-D-heptose 7-phosphate kinase / D-beta-D-heptose 1-phosphate adenosyltransferase
VRHAAISSDWLSALYDDDLQNAKDAGKLVVVVNGVFDILHAGHVHLFREARVLKLGGETFVVAALNSDDSARRLKGPDRPYFTFDERAGLVAALRDVDLVVCFNEDTPEELLSNYEPDALVKGAEYLNTEVPGAGHCAKVHYVRMRGNLHTSELVRRIRKG